VQQEREGDGERHDEHDHERDGDSPILALARSVHRSGSR
jgi:hypothetical protein